MREVLSVMAIYAVSRCVEFPLTSSIRNKVMATIVKHEFILHMLYD